MSATPRHVPASDDYSRALGTAVARRIADDRDAVVAVARRNLARARGRYAIEPSWIRQWHDLLDGPTPDLIDVLTSPGEAARVLRQSSPFAGVLTPRERWTLLAEVKEARRASRSA